MGACVPVGTSSCSSGVGVKPLLVGCVLEVEMCGLLRWLLIVWRTSWGLALWLGESALGVRQGWANRGCLES